MPTQKIKNKTAAANDKAANIMTVNNCFAHWVKEIDISKCKDDLQILPTNNAADIYRYSDAIFKHMPKYGKRKVILSETRDRRLKNSDTAADRTDEKLTDKTDRFANVINEDNPYRIPLKFFGNMSRKSPNKT